MNRKVSKCHWICLQGNYLRSGWLELDQKITMKTGAMLIALSATFYHFGLLLDFYVKYRLYVL